MTLWTLSVRRSPAAIPSAERTPPAAGTTTARMAAAAAAEGHTVDPIEHEVPVGRHRVQARLGVNGPRVEPGEHPLHMLDEPVLERLVDRAVGAVRIPGVGAGRVLAHLVPDAGGPPARSAGACRARRGR